MRQDVHRKQQNRLIFKVDFMSSNYSEDNDTDGDEPDTIKKSENFQKLRMVEQRELGCYKEKQQNKDQQPEFKYFKYDDEDIYFVISTYRGIQKGEQVYTTYGRRSAQFLLLWYGFCLEKSPVDSVQFRINNFDNSIFLSYVNYDEMEKGFIIHKQRSIKIDMLTKTFRLKSHQVCDDLLLYLRMNCLQKTPQSKIKISYPTDLHFELKVLEQMKAMVGKIAEQILTKKVSLEKVEDAHKKIMIQRFNESQTHILKNQMVVVKLCIFIVTRLINGSTFYGL